VQQSNTHLIQKHTLSYAAITIVGVSSLLLGLYLIIVVGYHERAYVFLGIGTGCFIGGIAGIIETRAKFKTALSYGMIALGMMGIVVGINYLVDRYGPSASPTRAALVLSASVAGILIGIFGAWIVQPKGGIAKLSSVLTLGIIASVGIVAVTVGIIYKFVLNSPTHAYMLSGVGVVCLVIGIVGGVFLQSRTKRNYR
jgi:hypothetical protein